MYNWLISLCLAALVNRVDAFPKAMNNPHGSKMINPATNKRRQGRSEYSFSHDVGCQEGSPPGLDYTGIANMTEDGLACQVWAEADSYFTYLGEHNHCRNPDQDPDGVWCYTTDPDKRWEHCSVPICSSTSSESNLPTDTDLSADNDREQHRSISSQEDQECQEGSPLGASYLGRENVTASGRTCQVWSRI